MAKAKIRITAALTLIASSFFGTQAIAATASNSTLLLDAVEHGIVYQSNSKNVYTFNNLREYGYIDVNFDISNAVQSTIFSVSIDGVEQAAADNYDISKAEVLQIQMIGDLTDVELLKNSAHPTLEVYDIEFNNHDQITENTLMQYVTSFDASGKDITNNVNYTTNYKDGVDGTYYVKYSTKDSKGNSYTRTVDIEVYSDDYSRPMTNDELKEPFVDYLYHGRNIMDEQGRKTWDLVLDTVMNFDKNDHKLINRWSTSVYEVNIPLVENGIYVDLAEIRQLSSQIQDSEQRAFIVPDWGFTYKEENGVVSSITLWVRENLIEEQEEYLKKMEENTQMLFADLKDGMSFAQQYNVVMQDYANWIVYRDGNTMYTAMVHGVGKCGGHSRGASYLAQRLGIKSVYAVGQVADLTNMSHAWAYQYIPETDAWYLTDMLWGRLLAAPIEPHPIHESYYRNDGSRTPEFFEFGTEAFPREDLEFIEVVETKSTLNYFGGSSNIIWEVSEGDNSVDLTELLKLYANQELEFIFADNDYSKKLINSDGSFVSNVDGYTDGNGCWIYDGSEAVMLHGVWTRTYIPWSGPSDTMGGTTGTTGPSNMTEESTTSTKPESTTESTTSTKPESTTDSTTSTKPESTTDSTTSTKATSTTESTTSK